MSLGPTIIDPNDHHPRCKNCGNYMPPDLQGEGRCSYCNHKFVVDESRIIEKEKTGGSLEIPLEIQFPEGNKTEQETVELLKEIKDLIEKNFKVNQEILKIIKDEKTIINFNRRIGKG